MAQEHTPPSSYLLQDLHEVMVPENVSWLPQTVGWKILAIIVVLLLLYCLYRQLYYRWDNRYRFEALDAVSRLDMDDPELPTRLFSIVKIVLIYLDKQNARLFDETLFAKLDQTHQKGSVYEPEIARLWLESIVNPSVRLDEAQCRYLLKTTNKWLRHHIEDPDKVLKRTFGYQWRTVKSWFAKGHRDGHST